VSDATPSRLSPTRSATARLSLGNPSPGLSTGDHLRFQLDHALARDAVHTPLDTALLLRNLRHRNWTPLLLHSNAGAAGDPNARRTYLRRPDLGRTLHPDSISTLQTTTRPVTPGLDSETWVEAATNSIASRTLILLADGLSALALERHALPLLDALRDRLEPGTLNREPVPLITNARVAIADEVGQLLGADITVLLIGERPGLSSPDSLGCYITWQPRPGRTDAERNCISNIRGDEGLSYAEAAHRIAHYLAEAQRLQTTGIALKDPTSTPALP